MKDKKPEQPTNLLAGGGEVSSSMKAALEFNQCCQHLLLWFHIIIDCEHFDALLCALHMDSASSSSQQKKPSTLPMRRGECS
jgi:hypothetical protein